MRKLNGLKPERVFYYFEEICSIPHGSGDTDKISLYCVDFAKKNGLSWRRDDMNNVIIKKDASKGYEDHPAVILQGHLDMVCEKDPDCNINFETDGLDIETDGEFIWANGTTLGGDDGIAIAMAMAILEDESLPHPAIEAIFTTDEETGMYGAEALDTSDIKSRILINVDSENEGILTVSCAGGARAEISIPLELGEAKDCRKIKICGLIGGHSGVEIDKGRHNSNVLMGKLLKEIGDFEIADIKGGLKDNAIPVLTECIVHTSADLKSIAEKFIKASYTANDPNLEIAIEEAGIHKVFSPDSSKKIADFLCKTPNGIIDMSRHIEGLVETSLNLGILFVEENELKASYAVRSSVNSSKLNLLKELKALAEAFGGKYSDHGHYPAWEYREDSPLRDTMVAAFKELYGKEPIVEAIHAGLECGLFCEKMPGLDAVSLGPDMQDIHTPREKLSVASSERCFKYLCKVLEML